MKTLTKGQFLAAAKLARRGTGPGLAAALDVMVHGLRPVDAAKKHGISRQALNGWLAPIRAALELAELASPPHRI